MDRTTIEGPAVVEYNSVKYYSEGAITLTPETSMRDITSSMWGRVQKRMTDKIITVGFTPMGMLNNQTAYWPYTVANLGAALAPSSDLDITIWAASGVKIVLKAGVITQCPQLILAADKGPFGPMTLTAMGALTKATGVADCMHVITSAAIASHALDLSKILTPGYKAELIHVGGGVGGIDEVEHTFESEEGFTFDGGYAIQPRKTNAYGTVNFKLTDIQPKLTFKPYGPTETQALAWLNLQGASGTKIGAANTLGRKLKVSPADGSGITLEFADCQLESMSLVYGATDPRHGDYVFSPALVITNGVASLFTVTFPTFA